MKNPWTSTRVEAIRTGTVDVAAYSGIWQRGQIVVGQHFWARENFGSKVGCVCIPNQEKEEERLDQVKRDIEAATTKWPELTREGTWVCREIFYWWQVGGSGQAMPTMCFDLNGVERH